MEEQQLYEKYLNGRHWENHPTLYAEKFLDFLKENKFKGLLVDIGCGDGRDTNFFFKKGIKVIGIDYSEDEINNAKKKFPETNFEIQNAEHLQFKNDSIDAFFMINVIHYIDKRKALDEIMRTLKSKGYFFIHFNMKITDGKGNLDYKHAEEDIKELISGFKVISSNVFTRKDCEPFEHNHKIMELILQKK